MPNEFSSKPSSPTVSEGNTQDLGLESTLQELSLYNFQVEASCLGLEVARVFEKYPLLPGAILVEQGQFIGMLSRRRLLEFLIRPHGLDLFLQKPLSVLYSYARTEVLILADSTPILAAIQQALRRSPELLGEPVVVKTDSQTHRLLDFQDLNVASWQIRGIETQVRYERSQVQMIQSDKMASLGRLVDGVAHEILEPVGFIWGNLSHVSTYSQSLLQVLSAYEAHMPCTPAEITQLKEENEFNFLQQDLPRATASILTGTERLRKLAKSLQNFCYIDEVYPKPADLHACLDSIVLLMNSRLRGEIEIVRNYGHLPPVPCFVGQLNQVFMNILSNAVDALLDEAVRLSLTTKSKQAVRKPRIEITTQLCSSAATPTDAPNARWVSIRIADNGPGMSKEKQQQILESFSVERRVTKETSLALSYWIVRARHGGKLILRSRHVDEGEARSYSGVNDFVNPELSASTEGVGVLPAVGTEFEILLPLA